MTTMPKRALPIEGHDRNPTERTEWAQMMTDDEYYPFLVKKNIRPAIWRWADARPKLEELSKDKLRRADRRFLSLVNSDTGEAGGVLPSLFLGLQIDHQRTRMQQRTQCNEPSVLVRQGKVGHRFADPRTDFTTVQRFQAGDQLVIGCSKIGPPGAALLAISGEFRAQRRI